ncbi:cytochrome c family protein [Candidatus Desantisbacteria bacterium]|nr:cytochrome c family protein [Candidatus Desantisbacteria bacterium]
MKKLFFTIVLTFSVFFLFCKSLYCEDIPSASANYNTSKTDINKEKNLSTTVSISNKPAPKYVGAKECGICHTGKKMKNIYENWQKQGHSRAFERLKGVDKENPNCLKCHTTGYGKEKLYAEVNLEGVQCEACHGPGSLYRPIDIMEDRKRSNELGLIFPIDPMKVCRECHLHRQDRVSPLCPGRD